MKLVLALNGFYEQGLDIAYDGALRPKEAFRCANIDDNNYCVEDLAKSDPYPAFAEHFTMNVLPVIENGLKGSKYLVHCLDAEQGEIHPHFLIRRKDLAVLNNDDCMKMKDLLLQTIVENNAANCQRANMNSSSHLFAQKKQADLNAVNVAPDHQHDLRHKKHG